MISIQRAWSDETKGSYPSRCGCFFDEDADNSAFTRSVIVQRISALLHYSIYLLLWIGLFLRKLACEMDADQPPPVLPAVEPRPRHIYDGYNYIVDRVKNDIDGTNKL